MWGTPLAGPGLGWFCSLGCRRSDRISAVVQRNLPGLESPGLSIPTSIGPGVRQPSHGRGGGGGQLRGPRRALATHAPVRPAARAARRALRGPGQLRRRAGLARPRWVRPAAAGGGAPARTLSATCRPRCGAAPRGGPRAWAPSARLAWPPWFRRGSRSFPALEGHRYSPRSTRGSPFPSKKLSRGLGKTAPPRWHRLMFINYPTLLGAEYFT